MYVRTLTYLRIHTCTLAHSHMHTSTLTHAHILTCTDISCRLRHRHTCISRDDDLMQSALQNPAMPQAVKAREF